MQFITIALASLATLALASHYDFTICSGGCTSTGCTGNSHRLTGDASEPTTINASGTSCTIFYRDSAVGKVLTCNKSNKCTQPGTNGGASCFNGKNGEVICNTSGTDHIQIIP